MNKDVHLVEGFSTVMCWDEYGHWFESGMAFVGELEKEAINAFGRMTGMVGIACSFC